jgi:putative transposase
MMKERGGTSINLESITFLLLLETAFRKQQRQVDTSWRMDGTYIKGNSVCEYRNRTVDPQGKIVDFLFAVQCNKAATMRFFIRP